MIKNTIRKKLIQEQEAQTKRNLKLSLVENNLKFVTKKIKSLDDLNSLSEDKKIKLLFSIAEEIKPLIEDQILNEQLGNILKSILGKTIFQGFGETAIENLLGILLNKLGLKDSYLRKAMISFIATDPRRMMAALSDCKELTKLIAESFIEAYVMKLEQDKGFDNILVGSLRNILGDVLRDNSVIMSIENALSGKVCEIFGGLTNKAKNVLNSIKKPSF